MSRVGKCFDERMTSNCENWAGRGLCKGIRGWKAYMEENCRKTCGFCKSSGESLFLQFAVHMSVRGMVPEHFQQPASGHCVEFGKLLVQGYVPIKTRNLKHFSQSVANRTLC